MKHTDLENPGGVIEMLRNAEGVVVYGAVPAAEAVLDQCREKGIAVSCICDDSSSKRNTMVCDYPIMSFNDALAATGHKPVFIIAVYAIENIVEKLSRAGHYAWTTIVPLFADGIKSDRIQSYPGLTRQSINTCYYSQKRYLESKLNLKSLDFVISERCSLKCADCSNLMQYYASPVNFSKSEILESLRSLLGVADAISELRVIGGEPMIHPDFYDIVAELGRMPQIDGIAVYTNGTIPLHEEKSTRLDGNRVFFNISNYAGLSGNTETLAKALEKRQIPYHVENVTRWTSCSSFEKHDRTNEELRVFTTNCCVKNATTLLKGALYRCPFIGNAMNLRAIPDTPRDKLDIAALRQMDMGEARKNLKDFLFSPDIASCDFCAGRPYVVKEYIRPAIQARQSLHYVSYFSECTQ